MTIQNRMMQHDPKDVEAFYEIICFSRALSVVRGDRIRPRLSAESDGFDLRKCRRDFADAIAYFCAYSGTPDCVTAVALGRRDTNVVLWVASNAKVHAKVIKFLNHVLHVLKEMACTIIQQGRITSNKQECERRLSSLLDDILQFTREKNFKYYKSAVRIWDEICASTEAEGLDNMNTDLIAVHEWFQRTFKKDGGGMLEKCDIPELAWRCYDARTTRTFGVLQQCSSQSNERRLDYERLYKLLYKLGKHVALFNKLVPATVALRRDFQGGFAVEAIPASTPKPIPLPAPCSWTMENIAARVFPDREERNQFLHHLNTFYDPSEVYQSLNSSRENGRIRVHAELLLIDHFDKVGGNFLDNNDKYIGCSKPACYLCYHYICQHPGNYTRPPSHQKLYHAWCLPNIGAHDPNFTDKFNRHERFLAQITEALRSDLQNEVRQQLAPRKYHADSTAGASSTVGFTRAKAGGDDDLIRTLVRILSEDTSASCDVDLEPGGVMLQC